MTDDEELELEIELAKARKNKPPAAQPTADELASGVSASDTGTYTTAQEALNQVKGAIRDTGEGLVKTVDQVPALAQGIINLPRRLNNAAASNAEGYNTSVSPDELKAQAPAPVALSDVDTAVASGPYNAAFPPDPAHPERRKIFNIAGELAPAIVMPELMAGRFNALKTGADLTTQTALTYGGGEGGETIDKALGGDGTKGRFVGSLASGGVFPVVKGALVNAGRNMWVDAEKSPARLAQAERLGVTPDLSLLGNESAAAAGKGRGFDKLRATQQREIDAAIQREANRVAGDPDVNAPGPIAKGDIGKATAEAADTASKNAERDANRIYDPMTKAVEDDNFIVSQAPVRDAIRDLRADKDTSVIQHPTINNYENISRADSKFPIDEALDTQLAAAREKIAAEKPSVSQAARLADVDNQIASNRGASWRATQTAKARGGAAMDTKSGADLKTEAIIHKGYDKALSDRAAEVGYDTPGVDDYKTVEREYGHLKGDQGALEEVAASKAPQAYNKVFSPTNEQDAFNLQRLALHTEPTELAQILSQNLELRGRGAQAAGRRTLPDQVGLNKSAPDWWGSLPEETKRVMVRDPRARANVDAAMNLSRLEQRRGSVSQIDPVENYPAASMTAAGLLSGHAGVAVGSALPRLVGRAAGGLLRSPHVTNRLIRGNEGLTPSDLARIMVAGVAGAN